MIGVFDSGFGGLTVLKEFVKVLPEYNYTYLGDNARAPYGDKSQETIYQYAREACDFLFGQGAEIIIIACNTASAKALRKLQQEYLPVNYPDKKILGVIIPVTEEAISQSRNGRIGIIGTRSTIESGKYRIELDKIATNYPKKNFSLNITDKACPLLVPLVEEGWINRPETKMILKKYLKPLKEKKIDSLILGCTHYPFLSKDIKRIIGKNTAVLNSPKIIAEKLQDYLERHEDIKNKIKKSGQRIYFTTSEREKFEKFLIKFIKEEKADIRRCSLN